MPDQTPRLYRSADRRVLGGVAQGLAEHLRLDPTHVRVGFVVLALFQGLGALLYAVFWAVLRQDPAPPSGRARRPARERALAVSVGVLGLGVLLMTRSVAPVVSGPLFYAVVLAGAGGALLWWQADESLRTRLRQIAGRATGTDSARRPSTVPRLVAGGLLVATGMATFLVQVGDLAATRDALLGTAVLLGGAALITAPWWRRLVEVASAERRERIRSQERAELAAHLHDSVLHTLALIQRHVGSPREVARLARGQERELRNWLYPTREPAGASRLSSALEEAAASVENAYAITVETVVVGDADLDERLAAIVQAAREALVNAAKHAGVDTVSLYGEVEPGKVTIFVRDRGAGFDPDAVPAHRHGVSESMVGRMARHGGSARITTGPGAGTEVELTMTRAHGRAQEQEQGRGTR